MTFIRSKFKDDSLHEMYDYLNNIILFHDDIKKIRFALEDIKPSENDSILFDKINNLLDYYDEQENSFLSRKPISNEINFSEVQAGFPKEVWSLMASFMTVNQRLSFRQINRAFKNIIDVISINETIIFPKKLSPFDGFIQTNINKSGFRSKSNLCLGELFNLLSNLNQEDQRRLASITKKHHFAKSEIELNASVDTEFHYMDTEQYSLKIQLKQSMYTGFKLLLFFLTIGLFGLTTYLYSNYRDEQDRLMGENFLVTVVSVMAMAYISISIAKTTIFSTYASEQAAKNMHALFNAADSANAVTLNTIKTDHRLHNDTVSTINSTNTNTFLSEENKKISEMGHTLFSRRINSMNNKAATFPELNHLHRQQRSYSI